MGWARAGKLAAKDKTTHIPAVRSARKRKVLYPARMRSVNLAFCAILYWSCSLFPQSTQGVISGRVVDSILGAAIPDCEVFCWNVAMNFKLRVVTNSAGYYA